MASKYNLMIRNLLNKNSGYHVNIVTDNVICQSAGFIRHSCWQYGTWEETMGDNHIKIGIAVPFRIFNKFTLKSPHIYDVNFFILILLSKEEN